MGQVDIVRASAGSGKTFRLAYEYVKRVVAEPHSFSSILAVTFTNKATEQMKSRILKELHTLSVCSPSPFIKPLQEELLLSPDQIYEGARKALRLILHDYSHFSVYTIDRFFQKILRAFATEISLDGDYEIELDEKYLLQLAIDNLLDRAKSTPDIALWLEEYTQESVKNGASYNIADAMESVARRVLDEKFDRELASSGIAERRALLEAIFERSQQLKDQIVDKAKEFVNRMQAMDLTVNDFSYKDKGFANYPISLVNGKFEPYKARVVAALEPDSKWGKAISGSVKSELQPILIELCQMWDDSTIFINSANALSKHWRTYIMLGEISSLLDEVSRGRGAMLLSKAAEIITSLVQDNDAPFIYEKVGNRYSTFMIDEFQDTSLVQWNNFLPLVTDAASQSEPDVSSVLFVGDVKQSIYGWRGGDWSILQGGIESSMGASVDQINIETLPNNWRSEKRIVEFNNVFIKSTMEQMNNHLNEMLTPSAARYKNLLPKIYGDMYQEPAQKEESGYIEANICDFKEGENLSKMTEQIKWLQDEGVRAEDIAIIVRTNTEAQSVADHLLQQKNMVGNEAYCFDIVSADALRIDGSPVVQFLIAAMTQVIKDDITSETIISAFLGQQQISDEKMYLWSLKNLSPVELLEELMEHYEVDKRSNSQAYLQALYDMIIDYSHRQMPDLRGFLVWWNDSGSSKKLALPEGAGAINIITTHKSKGLEYQAVIIPYMSWEFSPRSGAVWGDSPEPPFLSLGNSLINFKKELAHSYWEDSYFDIVVKEAIESFNILYVALTRACAYLSFMLPAKPKGIATLAEAALLSNEVRQMASYCDQTRLVIGERVTPSSPKPIEAKIEIDGFEGTDFRKRIKIHLSARHDGNTTLSPRAKGVLLHRLFEGANSKEDVLTALAKIKADGELESEQLAHISDMVTQQLENPLVASWFDSSAKVFCERAILLGGGSNERGELTRRPDRVVVSDDGCMVVDYKFGAYRPSHSKQIKEYCELLEQMGYTVKGGYVWYVGSGEIIEC